MRYLVVASHPDDEVLGAGATIHNLSSTGDEVYVCLLSKQSPTRYDNLKRGIRESHRILGVKKSYMADFRCLKFKDEDHHKLVRFIESCIKKCCPDVLITHHPSDVHLDHNITAECCMEASKLPMRQIANIPPIKKIMFMEVPSSTDWNINHTTGSFVANTFKAVSHEDLLAKINAADVYENVVRESPHPRSEKSMMALSVVRGSQCGAMYAEAFHLVFGLEA